MAWVNSRPESFGHPVMKYVPPATLLREAIRYAISTLNRIQPRPLYVADDQHPSDLIALGEELLPILWRLGFHPESPPAVMLARAIGDAKDEPGSADRWLLGRAHRWCYLLWHDRYFEKKGEG